MDVYVREYIRSIEAFGWEGGPEFNTAIQPMLNKREKRNAMWSQSRFFASLPFNNILPGQYENILSMFEDRMGRWGAFLYRNRLADFAEDEEFAIGEAGRTTYQLGIKVGRPGRERTIEIHALYVPDLNSDGEASESDITIMVDGTPTSDVTIDHDTGVVEFDSPPGAGAVLTWSGAYSHWVRFDQDELPLSIDNRNGGQAGQYLLNGSVDVIGVPPPVAAVVSSSSSGS